VAVLEPHRQPRLTARADRTMTTSRSRSWPGWWNCRGEHRELGVPAGMPLRRWLHHAAGPGAPGVPALPVIAVICGNDSIHHPARSPPTWRSTLAGTAVRRPLQPARQPRPNGSGRRWRTT